MTLPDGVQVIGEYAFIRCAALTTVNLSQVTRIDEYAFWECTSLTALTLDNVTTIDHDAFYGCTGLETLKIPKCTWFGNYIVTGCKALTRIEATAAGNFVDISDGRSSIERTAVFTATEPLIPEITHSTPAKCDLVLNPDKYENGGAVPTPLPTMNGPWRSMAVL